MKKLFEKGLLLVALPLFIAALFLLIWHDDGLKIAVKELKAFFVELL